MSNLQTLRDLMRALRAPDGGCPWDREQTFESIVAHTLEEAFEVADVIESGRLEELPSELGDLLFQVIFYCQLAEEEGRFSIDEVIGKLERKLLRRHPHVFEDGGASDAAAVAKQWEMQKATERASRRDRDTFSELDEVPVNFPALTRALKLQKRAARVGFDWPDVAGAWAKLGEETAELEDAMGQSNVAAVHEELGDLLFAVVNVARHLGCDPEAALRAANRKFERRFRHVESALRAQGSSPESADLEWLDRLWEAAKKAGL
ncbi:MAG: nucleoside triphosphate pyrophosphohydrolase [Gammaproteobacteria bacterium]|nr:nucleoside triphosphate pyrophosphohydrolase [Gammaproteobacteria bacterium]